jgi:molybdopterin-guanine dinucleotide biosynthesis protein A
MFIKIEPLRKLIGESLMKARSQQPSEMHLCHDRLMEAPTTEAAIVAGGQARRFDGQDKSRLVVEGRTIIVRQLEILQQVTSEVYVVGAPEGRFDDLGLRSVPDVLPHLGAIGGIYSAVAVSQSEQVLVVACDLPFLDAGVLRTLTEKSIGRDGAWVTSERGIEPLLACYRRQTASKIRARIDRRQLKASDLATTLDMYALTGDELAALGPVDRLLANVNTPADYARVQYRPS